MFRDGNQFNGSTKRKLMAVLSTALGRLTAVQGKILLGNFEKYEQGVGDVVHECSWPPRQPGELEAVKTFVVPALKQEELAEHIIVRYHMRVSALQPATIACDVTAVRYSEMASMKTVAARLLGLHEDTDNAVLSFYLKQGRLVLTMPQVLKIWRQGHCEELDVGNGESPLQKMWAFIELEDGDVGVAFMRQHDVDGPTAKLNYDTLDAPSMHTDLIFLPNYQNCYADQE